MTPEENEKSPAHKRPRFRNFFKIGEVGRYFFRGKDPNRPANFNLRAMHIINRTAIIVFVLGIIFVVVRRCVL